jgi:hypothetical protein
MTKTETTFVTPTGIAVALAVIIALGFLFFGSAIFAPFEPQTAPAQDVTLGSEAVPTETGVSGTMPGAQGAAPIKPNAQAMSGDTVVGTGAEAVAGKKVTVNYVGMLENGTVFDASANHGQPFTFTLGVGQVIKGWDEGVAGMKVGGKRHLVIPPEKGYGAQGIGSIPPNSTLIFDVELVGVE